MAKKKLSQEQRLLRLANRADKLVARELLRIDEMVVALAERALRRTSDGQTFISIRNRDSRAPGGQYGCGGIRIHRTVVDRLVAEGKLAYGNASRSYVVRAA